MVRITYCHVRHSIHTRFDTRGQVGTPFAVTQLVSNLATTNRAGGNERLCCTIGKESFNSRGQRTDSRFSLTDDRVGICHRQRIRIAATAQGARRCLVVDSATEVQADLITLAGIEHAVVLDTCAVASDTADIIFCCRTCIRHGDTCTGCDRISLLALDNTE